MVLAQTFSHSTDLSGQGPWTCQRQDHNDDDNDTEQDEQQKEAPSPVQETLDKSDMKKANYL